MYDSGTAIIFSSPIRKNFSFAKKSVLVAIVKWYNSVMDHYYWIENGVPIGCLGNYGHLHEFAVNKERISLWEAANNGDTVAALALIDWYEERGIYRYEFPSDQDYPQIG